MTSTAASYNPTRDDFAAMLDESFAGGNLQESSVIKGKVVAIEKDMAVIDVGPKTGRRGGPREFARPGRGSELKGGGQGAGVPHPHEKAPPEARASPGQGARRGGVGE